MENTLEQAAHIMGGTLHGADATFHGVSTDSRTISAGQLFFGLRGPNFDGSRFVAAAARAQAAGAVVEQEMQSAVPLITVRDTRAALGLLAAAWRDSQPATVIGVTGSNGKTTLREMIAACLAQSDATLATEGNLNNEIGVPLTLLRLDEAHRYAVIEMGANHAGEIGYLASLAKSDVVVISNAGAAHLEGFGSIDGVAQAKGEILTTACRPRVAVLNADDPYFDFWRSRADDVQVLSFALDNEATVSAADIRYGESSTRFTLRLPGQRVPVELPLAGRHNVLNACAAAAVSLALDIPPAQIRAGLESSGPVSGRLQRLEAPNGAVVFNDSYNANPVSTLAAAEFLAAQAGDTILVLGDMGELGDDAAGLHAEVGRAVRKAGVDRLLATGELSRHAVNAFGDNGSWFADIDALIESLRMQTTHGSRILVKGSRAMRMERVVDALIGNGNGNAAEAC